jgi:hypothetical protein
MLALLISYVGSDIKFISKRFILIIYILYYIEDTKMTNIVDI